MSMEICKKSLASKIHKIKKVVRPLLAIIRRKRRHNPEGAESSSYTTPAVPVSTYMNEEDPTVPPVWQVNFRTEVDDNAANEALEARLKEFIHSTPYPGCRLQIEGSLTITPMPALPSCHYDQYLNEFEEPYIPIHFDNYWENTHNHNMDTSEMYFRDSDAVTSRQQAEMQMPYYSEY